jgi:tripartite-type tricarboxylate transporter receptor subunit TctC
MKYRFLIQIAGGVIALASAMGSSVAQAQAWPDKPIKVVVAFAPGGPADIAGRLVAQALQEGLGQQTYVENKGGAGGNIAARLVAKEPADGYTLLITTSSIAVNQTLYKDPGFDVRKDFTPVILVADSPNILVSHTSEPANNLQEFFRLYKGKGVSYGSAGIGSTPHLTGDHILRKLGGLDAVHIPYKGAAPALLATAANQVQIASVALPPAIPLVIGGKVKALAVTSLKRNPSLPDVPTVAESGFPGFEDYTWVGLFAPANLPPELVARLNTAVGEALKSPKMLKVLATVGLDAKGGSPAEFKDYLNREVDKWGQVIKETGVEPQ